MSRNEEPMPLGDLPGYIRSVREGGQGDYAPVVDVGRIVDNRPGWGRVAAFSSVAFFLFFAGMYGVSSTGEISISSSSDPASVSKMVSEEGGKVFSVKRDEDGTYKMRVFSFGGTKNLVERLREKMQFDGVELKD